MIEVTVIPAVLVAGRSLRWALRSPHTIRIEGAPFHGGPGEKQPEAGSSRHFGELRPDNVILFKPRRAA
jgi:hypothetical protein